MQPQYIIRGKVRHGNKRGRKLGFPTVNVDIHQQISDGVYVSMVKYEKSEFYAVTFIGKAETFNETKYQSETYIFDFNKTIYHKWLSIKIYKKLRSSKKFKSEKELIEQIKKDVRDVEKFIEVLS